MLKIRVNDQFDFELVSNKEAMTINGEVINADISTVNSKSFHIIYKNRSFNAELIECNKTEKHCLVKVNSNVYTVSITDQFDELLHKLGMDKANSSKVSELKAPMPGLVLRILVSEGEEVKKGGNLLILEAMKMENIIKAPADVIVKSIKINPSDKVEKGQVMMYFR